MGLKILLVEDAEESKDLVFKALGPAFEIEWVTTLEEAHLRVNAIAYDLVLLDVGLPDGDGFHFFSTLKNDEKFKNLPIIFLTARDSDPDKVLGITLGAEDYIVKPFSSMELKARVEMRIKKGAQRAEEGQVIRRGNIEVNLPEQRVYLVGEGPKKDLTLTSLEFKILVHLLKNEERVFSRENLLNLVWGENTFLTDRTIDTHIYSLRKKLGPRAIWIKSIYGQGYRFSTREVDQESVSKKVA